MPFYPFWGRVPLLKYYGKKGYLYSNLSTGEPNINRKKGSPKWSLKRSPIEILSDVVRYRCTLRVGHDCLLQDGAFSLAFVGTILATNPLGTKDLTRGAPELYGLRRFVEPNLIAQRHQSKSTC